MQTAKQRYLQLIIDHLKHDAVILSFHSKYLVTAEWMDTGYYIDHELYLSVITSVELASKQQVSAAGHSFTIEYFINA